jgi:tetratricopeptide (TPR) repeat protein
MPSLFRRSFGIGLRIVVAGGCCLAIWNSWKFAVADFLFQKDTEDSIRAAIRLVPDGWQYYMRLAQFDQGHTRNLLATSLRLNRYNAQADIELGLQYETEGDFARAEKLLLDAYAVDHTYLPRWSLANFYLRRDNMPAFWAWARSAALMPADDVGPLFELCWRVSPDPKMIAGAILNEKPELIRQYLRFLLTKGQLQAAADASAHLIRFGEAETDCPLLFDVVNRLVAANEADPANTLWKSLIAVHWVVADMIVPNNSEFKRDPLPVSFDWSLPEYSGLHSWTGASGLETEFTGSQPEECTVAEQALSLAPGSYTLAYVYHTSNIPQATGIRWQIIDTKSNTILAESADLSSEAVAHSALTFNVPNGTSILRLRLGYRRALGTPRISGTLMVESARIRTGSPS